MRTALRFLRFASPRPGLRAALVTVAAVGALAPASLGQVTVHMPPPPPVERSQETTHAAAASPATTAAEAGNERPAVGDVALARFAGARNGPRPGANARGPFATTRWWSGSGYHGSYGYGYRPFVGWPYGHVVRCGRGVRHGPRHAVPAPGSFTHVRGYPRTPRIRHANQFSPLSGARSR